jgi:AcrR family transcriptional regulator
MSRLAAAPMAHQSTPSRRPRGRPQVRSDDETRALITEAALVEFQLHGYAGAGMSLIAQNAGVSTKTLYRLIPTKAEIFKTIIIDRISQFNLALDEAAFAKIDITEALRRALFAYGKLTLSREVIAITRLVYAEGDRFPELARAFYDHAVTPSLNIIARYLARETSNGRIRVTDPAIAAGMLRGMMTMEVQRAVILGQREAPTLEEIDARAAACAALFLEGCRKS